MTESKSVASRPGVGASLDVALFWTCGALLAIAPLAFTTAVYRTFTLPKFVVLIVGSAAILLMLALRATLVGPGRVLGGLKSKFVGLVCVYLLAVALSTLWGVAPLASLFGSYPNEMGLISRVAFFLLFAGLILAVGRDPNRLHTIVWIMALTGMISAAYAVAQFVGMDPFLQSSSYTFGSPAGPVVRVNGTLGHSNYLGNFLLYTTPIAVALAIASRGRPRRIAFVGAAVSAAAIVFSGTRGAWVGLLVGAITFAFVEWRAGDRVREPSVRSKRIGTAAAVAAAIIFVLVIIASPASRNVAKRARSFASDQFTGSGRLFLWRDAVRMIPAFSLRGCGPEGFGKAFLAYKSRRLAISAPTINNESSHNSYLDASISFGVPGAVAYIAMIAWAFRLLLKSRRAAKSAQTRLIITGLVASLAGVCVHNFFIYDQVPTGLYFFAAMALGAIAANVTAPVKDDAAMSALPQPLSGSSRLLGGAIVAASVALLAATVWFSVSLLMADAAIKSAFLAATTQDYAALQSSGERAIRAAEPTGAYNLLFARALATYAEAQPKPDGAAATGRSAGTEENKRTSAIEIGKAQAQRSLAHTLTPEANFVLLAYFALQEGNKEELREFASQAVRWDPNYFNARWLMAEALLGEGDKDGAVREARAALQLRPGNSEAMSVLVRAQGGREVLSARIQGLLERARLLREGGNATKARELLLKAIQFSTVPCASCHRELALVYEAAGQVREAIGEWQEFAREAPERATAEGVTNRIQDLRSR